MILLLHNAYRVRGGEERYVEDLAWLIRSALDEDVEVLGRDSAALSGGAAALGLLRGGLRPQEVGDAVRRTGARVVHAHNLNPAFGWRALAAARAAGARTILHLHNYRLVCANAVCFTQGADCVRCHGRDTRPGVRHNCRGGSRVEGLVYGMALAAWQQRVAAHVDRFVVPSAAALARLRELGAPVGDAVVVPSVQRTVAASSAAGSGGFVLYAGRVAEEKGVLDAVAACRRAGLPLVVAGDGPALDAVRAAAAGGDGGAGGDGTTGSGGPTGGGGAGGGGGATGGGVPVRGGVAGGATSGAGATGRPPVEVVGRLEPDALDALRRRAAVAIVPSRYHEILPLAALEAMAAGVPVVATAAGGLADAVPEEGLAPPGDVDALADRLRALWRDAAAGERALARIRAHHSPAAVAAQLREIYA